MQTDEKNSTLMKDAAMTEKGFKRKLTAILSADVDGYSRLMGGHA